MALLSTILLIIVALIGLLLIIALFMKRNHYVNCSITINAPTLKVYNFLKLLENQEAFNKHAQAGTDRIKTFTGVDGTVGFIYAWSGSKEAGKGEKEILALEEGKRIETEIRFVKPMVVSSRMVMETEVVNNQQTVVRWSNAGRLNYPLNLLIPVMQKSVAKDMRESLIKLKELLER